MPLKHSLSTLILAAGSGIRLNNESKANLKIGDQTLLEHSLALFSPFSDQLLVGLPEKEIEKHTYLYSKYPKVKYISGGNTRFETLKALTQHVNSEFVLVHDVARPFVTTDLIKRVLREGYSHAATTTYLPIPPRDAFAYTDKGYLGKPVYKENLIRTQPPQLFKKDILVQICQKKAEQGKPIESFSALVAASGHRVHLVLGEVANTKITYPEDLHLLESHTLKSAQ